MLKKYYDLQSERTILRVLLQNDEACRNVITYNLLHVSHFVDLFHRDCWNALMKYYTKYGKPPKQKLFIKYLKTKITFNDKYKTKNKQVKIWVKATDRLYISLNKDESDIRDDLENLEELRKLRIVQRSLIKISKDVSTDNSDNIISEMTNTIVACKRSDVIITQGNIVDDLKQHLLIDKQIKMGMFKPIGTYIHGWHEARVDGGWKAMPFDLDEYLNGGQFAGEMTIIVGKVNIGKSFMLMEIPVMAAVREKKNSVLYTIEMNKIKQQRRIYSRITGIPYKKFRMGLLTKEDRNKLRERIKQWEEHCGIIEVVAFDRGSTTYLDIQNKHTEVENKYGKAFEIASIDYLNDLKPINNRIDDRNWSSIGSISEGLANWAKYHNNHKGLVVITASQKKTTQYADKDTKSGSAAMSALPEHHATIGIGIGAGDEDEAFKRIRVDIFKNRDGEKGVHFYLYPNFEISKINSLKKGKEFYSNESEKEEK